MTGTVPFVPIPVAAHPPLPAMWSRPFGRASPRAGDFLAWTRARFSHGDREVSLSVEVRPRQGPPATSDVVDLAGELLERWREVIGRPVERPDETAMRQAELSAAVTAGAAGAVARVAEPPRWRLPTGVALTTTLCPGEPSALQLLQAPHSALHSTCPMWAVPTDAAASEAVVVAAAAAPGHVGRPHGTDLASLVVSSQQLDSRVLTVGSGDALPAIVLRIVDAAGNSAHVPAGAAYTVSAHLVAEEGATVWWQVDADAAGPRQGVAADPAGSSLARDPVTLRA